MRFFPLTLMAIIFFQAELVFACSAFKFDSPGGPVIGRNQDITPGVGLIFVNPRGTRWKALSEESTDAKPWVSWISKFGNLTFNHLSYGFPSGGMNEKGLVIEILDFPGSKVPGEEDPRPKIESHQWIQYQLDTAGTLDEVIENANKVRVTQSSAHYFVCEKEGHCAVLEYLEGKLASYRDAEFETPIVTNTAYLESQKAFTAYAAKPNPHVLPEGTRSLDRFIRLAERQQSLSQSSGPHAVDEAFLALSSVKQPTGLYKTAWSIVYEPKTLLIHYQADGRPGKRTSLNIRRFDYVCGKGKKVIDITGQLIGKSWISGRTSPFSTGLHRDLILRDREGRGQAISTLRLNRLVGYPAQTACQRQ